MAPELASVTATDDLLARHTGPGPNKSSWRETRRLLKMFGFFLKSLSLLHYASFNHSTGVVKCGRVVLFSRTACLDGAVVHQGFSIDLASI